MTILFHFRTQGTGAEGVHIAGIAKAFRDAGHTVVFSSPTGVDPLQAAGSNPFKTRSKSRLARLAARAPHLLFEILELAYNVPALIRNWKLIRQHRVELIYERHAFFLFSTAILAQWKRIPLVIEVNELAGDERVRAMPLLMPLARLADRITFRAATTISVVSPHLKRRICGLGIPEDKILVLPNAVEASSISAPSGREECRRQLGLDSAPVVGFVGWFVPWHRLDLLLEAVARIRQDGTPLEILLVGDGPLAEDLRQHAARLGISDSLKFTGAVPHERVRNYIDAMDIAVVPHSNAYRSPIKLFEFMARGRATVAPATEPVKLVIRDGENGILFEPLNASGLEAALRRLAGDSDLRTRVGEQARAAVRTSFTWDKNAEAVLRSALTPFRASHTALSSEPPYPPAS